MVTKSLTDVVDALVEAGIAATVDPPAINAPGAWVAARRLEQATLVGHYAVVVDVFLIARDNGIPLAIATLDDMLETALAVLDEHMWNLESTALDESVTLPSGGGPLPAYRVTLIHD